MGNSGAGIIIIIIIISVAVEDHVGRENLPEPLPAPVLAGVFKDTAVRCLLVDNGSLVNAHMACCLARVRTWHRVRPSYAARDLLST